MRALKLSGLCFAMAVLSGGFFATTSLHAQGNAITYQGRLNSDGVPANGSYDMTFSVWNTLFPTSQQGPTITNTAVAVSNGLFTTSLDFGNPNPYFGNAVSLQIGVRPNGSTNAFSIINPRQPLLATPYAIQTAIAFNATNVPATNITGAFPASQLPAAVPTNGSGSIIGTFIGNGAGIVNPPGTAALVSGTNVQMQVNSSYVTTNSAPVVFNLPMSNLAVGSRVRILGAGAGGWRVQPGNITSGYQGGSIWNAQGPTRTWSGVTISSDGSRLFATESSGNIFVSTDGINWAPQSPAGFWNCIASSANGSRVIAGSSLGNLYVSTDGGTNWIARGLPLEWTAVASSADGLKLVATAYDVSAGQIYTSTDGGTNWVARDDNRIWIAVASSADGSKLVAAEQGGQIYTSTDSGTNWIARENNREWIALTASADGSKLVAAEENGQIYTSTNSGTNWTARDSNRRWSSVASSADGTKLVAAVLGGPTYISGDSGVSWTAQTSVSVSKVASSGGGGVLVATAGNSPIYVSTGNGTSIELIYIGGIWQPVAKLDAVGLYGTISKSLPISGQNTLEFGAGVAGKDSDAGKIGYQIFSDGLDIVGAATNSNHKIKFWAEGGANFAGYISTGDSINSTGKITSPMWHATTVIDSAGPLNLSNTFTSNGGTLMIYTSGSGYATNASNLIGMGVFIDGTLIDNTAFVYANQTNLHQVFGPRHIFVNVGAGTHTLSLTRGVQTATDSNDRFNVMVLELPFF